jgi:hypothetical protein
MKNNLVKKSLALVIVFSSLLSTASLQSINRDVDIMKAKKPDLRVLGSELRDQNYYLREENKRLEATIEPRSYQKGKNEGLWIGIPIGAAVMGIVAGYVGYGMGYKNCFLSRSRR